MRNILFALFFTFVKLLLKSIFAVTTIILTLMEVSAQDFSITDARGQTLWYEILSDSTVGVVAHYTYNHSYQPAQPVWELNDDYIYDQIGVEDIIISDTVFHQNHTYKVCSIDDNILLSREYHYANPARSISYRYYQPVKSITLPNTIVEIVNKGGHYSNYNNSLSVTLDTIFYNAHNCSSFSLYGVNNVHTFIVGNDVDSFSIQINNIDTIIFNAINSHRGEFNSTSSNHITIGTGVKNLPSNLFRNFRNITSINIPSSVIYIGEHTFENCSNITSLTLPNNLKIIDNCAFKNCTGLNCDLSIPNTVVRIGKSAFYNCNGIASVNLSNRLNIIDDQAFYNCSNIRDSIVIPNSVDSICSNAFFNCSFKILSLGIRVSFIAPSAFSGCDSLVSLYYNSKRLSDAHDKESSPFYIVRNQINYLNIGDSVEIIPKYLFNSNGYIGSDLVLPASLKHINNSAFSECSHILNVFFNDNLISIGDSAFKNCTNISGKITIPNTTLIVGEHAFGDCSNIDTLIIGANNISASAFENCTRLRLLEINNAIHIGSNSFNNCQSISGHLFLPQCLQFIDNGAFQECDQIISVSINNASTTLGDSAFANCDRLVTVNMGDSVRSIGNSAFQSCFRLNNLQMGNTVTRIGDNAFNGCVRLPFPNLSSALTHIGSSAFQGCSLVQGDITIPAHVDTIGDNAFTGCGVISSITMQPVVPPTIFANTFEASTLSVPVYVPCSSYLQYYVTNYWENFPNLQGGQPFEVALSANNAVMGEATLTTPPTCDNYSAVITATAYNGFHFVRWNDGNSVNPRLVNLTQDTSFVAEFSANNAYITVHSADSIKGSVSGGGLYPYNGLVVLTATPNATFHFLRWSDGNTDNPRYLFATQDSSFTAIFVSNASYITVGNFNPEMGTVSGGGLYYYQQQISIMATPNYGYHFVQWNDGNMQNPRSIIVNCDTSFMAYFAPNIYAVSVNSNNTTMGTVTGTGNYHYNMFISISATANYGYHFSSWNDGNTNNPRTLTVTRDSAFTAQFAANTYQITVSPNDPLMGGAYGSGTYTYNSQTTISALPTYGYHFVQWNDGSTENPRTISVTQNAEYEAQFAINFYTITVGSNNPAIGSASGSGNYSYNSVINLVATPNYGYHFTQWSDGNTDNPRTVTVMQNATYTAQFAINSYTVTVGQNSAAMGMVAGNGNYIYNTLATITATPYYGYHFTQWNDGNTENPRTVVVSQDMSFTAQFDYNSYNVSAISNNITAGYTTGSGTYNYNSIVALTAIPSQHYHFVVWSDSVSENPRNIVVVNDTVYTAIFSIDQHTVSGTSNNSVMGTVQGAGSYDYGSNVTLSAVPNYGYHFIQWNDGSMQNPRHVSLVSDTSFVAMFGINSYSAVIMSSDTVMGSVNGSGTYNYQTQLTLMATPNYGYHFVQWSDGSTDNPRLLTITRDTVVMAVFAINIYQVDLSVNDSTLGEVFGAGAYTYLSQVVISASANEHCHFLQWSDGNTSNPRQITVIQNVALTAQFEEDERFLVQVVSSDDNMGSVTGGGEYYVGTQIRIEANPNPHYNFVHWSDGVTDNPRIVTVIENTTYTAVFSPEVYNVSVISSDETMGSVSGGGQYAYGSIIEISASARDGYHFVCWNDGDSSISRNIMAEEDVTYIAEFAPGVSVDDWEIKDIYIYPNPTKDMVYIISDESIDLIEIINHSGQIIQSFSQQNQVSLLQVPPGIYIMRIQKGEHIYLQKIIKQ